MKPRENYSGFKGVIKFIANIISWTVLVLLVIIALFLAYYTINNRIAAKKGINADPFISLYTIVSGSMEPNIKVYDVVVDKRVDSPTEIKPGDVITFTSTATLTKGVVITHRVVDVIEEDGKYYYKTKGDNNLSPDSAPAEYDFIIGKVIFRIPALGKVQSFIGTQAGWLLVIVIPALFVIISDILKIFKLTGVKNKIEKIEEKDKLQKQEKALQEEKRKEEIKKRLKLEKNVYESEPILVNKRTKIIVSKKAPIKKENQSSKTLSRSENRKGNNHNVNHKKKKKKRNN